jgi:hypothetical protein
MPDAKECRRLALECIWLAQAPASPHARETYLNLAKTWLRIANELGLENDIENGKRPVGEQNDFEYKNAS